MGASEFISASKKDAEDYFQKEGFKASESLDIEKFRASIYNEGNYVAYQKYLEGLYKDRDTNFLKLQTQTNKYYRKGIPDELKRSAFLHYFDLTPEKGKINYRAIYSLTNQDEFEIIQEDKPSFPFLQTGVLNEQGVK